MNSFTVAYPSLIEAALGAHSYEEETGQPAFVIDQHAPDLVPNPIDGYRVLVLVPDGPLPATTGEPSARPEFPTQWPEGLEVAEERGIEEWLPPQVYWLPGRLSGAIFGTLLWITAAIILLGFFTHQIAGDEVLMDLVTLAVMLPLALPLFALAASAGRLCGSWNRERNFPKARLPRLLAAAVWAVLLFAWLVMSVSVWNRLVGG